MYQHQFVQTYAFEQGYQYKDSITKEVKQKPTSFLYNFQTSAQILNHTQQNKSKVNIHKSQPEISTNIQSPPFRKVLNKNMEGKALLTKLVFPQKSKSVIENEEQKNEKQESPTKIVNYHSARKLNSNCLQKSEQKQNKNTQWINSLALPSLKSSLFFGKDKIMKSTTSRKRQLSMLEDITPVSSRNLIINGFQSQFTSRNKSPNKK